MHIEVLLMSALFFKEKFVIYEETALNDSAIFSSFISHKDDNCCANTILQHILEADHVVLGFIRLCVTVFVKLIT